MSDPAANDADNHGFLARARLRRRMRQLEQIKEINLRDIGGLMFELRRAGASNAALVDAKLDALQTTDDELSTLRAALAADSGVTELREPGLTTCANCGALIGSAAKFCSECGTPTSGS